MSEPRSTYVNHLVPSFCLRRNALPERLPAAYSERHPRTLPCSSSVYCSARDLTPSRNTATHNPCSSLQYGDRNTQQRCAFAPPIGVNFLGFQPLLCVAFCGLFGLTGSHDFAHLPLFASVLCFSLAKHRAFADVNTAPFEVPIKPQSVFVASSLSTVRRIADRFFSNSLSSSGTDKILST